MTFIFCSLGTPQRSRRIKFMLAYMNFEVFWLQISVSTNILLEKIVKAFGSSKRIIYFYEHTTNLYFIIILMFLEESYFFIYRDFSIYLPFYSFSVYHKVLKNYVFQVQYFVTMLSSHLRHVYP